MSHVPDLSVVITTPDSYQTIRQTIGCLRAQTGANRIEVVIVAPSKLELQLDETELVGFHGFQIVEVGAVESLARANAAGVRAAKAPIVVFAEDHAFPQRGWAEALIAAHGDRRAAAAVGPVVRNGNPASAVSWADFLIAYGQWSKETSAKVCAAVDHLPGHNSSYKRDLLLAYGARLEAMLEAETVLHWDLRHKGHELFLEPKASIAHLNFAQLPVWMRVQFHAGRVFAAARARQQNLFQRIVFFCGSPLIPLVRFRRIIKPLRGALLSKRASDAKRRQQQQQLPGLPIVVAALIAGLTIDAAGQMIGYAFAEGNSKDKLSAYEFHRQRYLGKRDDTNHARQT